MTSNISFDKKKDLARLLPAKVSLDKLEVGKTKQNVVIRVLRMWEAKNFKLNRALMSLYLLLLDEKKSLIQGSIHHLRIHRFKDLLKEGNMYLISNFEVVPSYSHYKVTNNPFTIRFTDTTQIMEVAEEVCSIKLEKFRIHSYAEFQSFAGTNLHLFDVVGHVLEIQGSNLEVSGSIQKIVLLLLLEDYSSIRVTLWDDQASEFRQQFQQSGRDCTVIVVTCLNPKMFAGKLHLNSSGSTKVYINYNLEVVKDFMARMEVGNSLLPPKIVEDDNLKQSLENWTIEQILQYISSEANQEKEVIYRAKIINICSRNGWKYLSCGSCSKKLERSATSLICNQCDKNATIGIARFRIELIVESGERTTTFVLFDRDVKKLVHTTAEDIIGAEATEGEITSNNQVIPKCLLELIGKTMDFQVKISEYNFQSSVQSFTVTRVIKETLLSDSEDFNIVAEPTKTRDEAEDITVKKIKREDGDTLPTFGTSTKVNNEQENEGKGSKKRRLI